MTAQLKDVVHLRRGRYNLLAVDGRGLFHARDHDIPVARVSCCVRGFTCRYFVIGQDLYVRDVAATATREFLESHPDGSECRIANRKASVQHSKAWLRSSETLDRESGGTHITFRRPGLPCPYSGAMLVGRGLVQTGNWSWLRDGIGPIEALSWHHVTLLTFADGRVVAETDVSGVIAEGRRRYQAIRHPAGQDEDLKRFRAEWKTLENSLYHRLGRDLNFSYVYDREHHGSYVSNRTWVRSVHGWCISAKQRVRMGTSTG